MTPDLIRLKLFSIKFTFLERVFAIPTVPISVVIPAYNAERFIREAIESVHAQTVSTAEIIVIDNNCTDQTSRIAEESGVTVIKEKKQNLSAARNAGIRACKHDWIALLDADDLWDKKKIEYQWKAIQNCPKVGIISCDFTFLNQASGSKIALPIQQKRFDRFKNRIIINKHCSHFPRIEAALLDHFGFLPSTAIFHREVFSGVGLFDETIDYQEDVEFFMRATTQFPLTLVHKPMVFYRRHDENMTINLKDMEQSLRLLTQRMLRFPDNYAPGAGQFYLERLRKLFVEKASAKARQH